MSTACKAELAYAFALGRPVLPIMIKPVAIGLTPERIANSQIVDYTTRGADQAIKLAGDLQAIHAPPAAPRHAARASARADLLPGALRGQGERSCAADRF